MLIVTITYTLILLISSTIPGENEAKNFQFFINLSPTLQNMLHLPAYALLSILWLGLSEKFEIIKMFGIAGIFGFCFLFGTLNEILQIAIPGRYASLTDVLLNTLGVYAGILIYLWVDDKKVKN